MSEETAESLESTVQFVCFYVGEVLCGIDIRKAQEINKDMNITQVPLAEDYVRGIMNLRGKIVTIVDLGRKLELTPVKHGEESKIVIVSWQDEFVGLLVDKIYDVVAEQEENILPAPSNIEGAKGKYFQGVIKREDTLIGLLDVETVLAPSKED